MKRLIIGFAAIVVVTASACTSTARVHIPEDKTIAFDATRSVRYQQPDWLGAVQREVIDRIGYGDRVRVFLIDGNTATSGALFDETIPLEDGTYDGDKRALRKLNAVKKSVQAAAEKAWSGAHGASSTDLFSLFGRRWDPKAEAAGRPRRLIVFSDGLHDHAGFRIDDQDLTPKNIARLVPEIIARHGLKPDMLSRTTVDFVLDERPHRNSRHATEAFFKQLTSSLGGELALFDSVATASAANFAAPGGSR